MENQEINGRVNNVVILNALPLNAVSKKTAVIYCEQLSLGEFVKAFKNYATKAKEVKCYVRHQGTVALLNKMLGVNLIPSDGLYNYEDDDIMFIITLKRPARGQEVTEVKLEDLDIRLVTINDVSVLTNCSKSKR